MTDNYRVSLHNHTSLSDGVNTAEEMIEEAIRRGFTHFGITDHCCTSNYEDYSLSPDRYDEYVDFINELKERYEDRIEVFAGIETERYGDEGYLMSDISSVRDRLDYIVGSVHTFEYRGYYDAVDEERVKFSRLTERLFDGDAKKLVERYFSNYTENIKNVKPEVAGHVDLVKKNNSYSVFFDENDEWYRGLVENALDVIKKYDCVMEINTGGAYKHGLRCIYPDIETLKMARDRNIKITMSSDAHSTDMIGYAYGIVLHRLEMCGIKKLYTYSNAERGFIPFDIG